jgi:hypothetical protein
VFSERGKLPSAILPHIDHALDLRVTKQGEKFLSGFPGEANGAQQTTHMAWWVLSGRTTKFKY